MTFSSFARGPSSPSFRGGLRGAAPIALVLVAAASLSAACNEAPRADAPGNAVVDDTRNQPRPPPTPEPATDASVSDADVPYADAAGTSLDGYAPSSACAGCACTPDAHYCFGGGTPRAILAPAVDAGGDAGIPACTVAASSATTEPGCNAVPPACASAPTCECLLAALQPRFRCYLVCQPSSAELLVYCPTP